MYVYVHVCLCMSRYAYVLVCPGVSVHVYVCMYACMSTCMDVRMYGCMYVCVCAHPLYGDEGKHAMNAWLRQDSERMEV